jgi:hypothetical protein
MRMTGLTTLLCTFRDVRVGDERAMRRGQVDEVACVYLRDEVLYQREGEEALGLRDDG